MIRPPSEKLWTRDDIVELTGLAKRRGISKAEFARRWLGVHPSTLSSWMSQLGNYQLPSPMARKLLSCIEKEFRRLRVKSPAKRHQGRCTDLR